MTRSIATICWRIRHYHHQFITKETPTVNNSTAALKNKHFKNICSVNSFTGWIRQTNSVFTTHMNTKMVKRKKKTIDILKQKTCKSGYSSEQGRNCTTDMHYACYAYVHSNKKLWQKLECICKKLCNDYSYF